MSDNADITSLLSDLESRFGVRAARQGFGLSQAELADLAGVSLMTVRNFEAGRGRATPTTKGNIQDALRFVARRASDAAPVDSLAVPGTPNPSLDRIAAALERIAASLERSEAK